MASVTLTLDVLHWMNINLISRNVEHKLRIGVFAALTTFGLIPLIHWVQLNGYESESALQILLLQRTESDGLWGAAAAATSAAVVQQFLGHMIGAYTIIGIGFVIYILRVPEKLSPGKFDILVRI